MEITIPVLKKEILEKAIAYTNRKLGIQLELLSFTKEEKAGTARIALADLNPETAFKIGMLLNERIQLISNHRWGKI